MLHHSLIVPGTDDGGNWEVMDAQSPKSDSRFYLNVCHKVVQSGGAVGCPVKASVCAVGRSQTKEERIFHSCYILTIVSLPLDKEHRSISLGSFLSSPQKTEIGNDIRLIYSDGSFCNNNKKRIRTILTLKCKPGRLKQIK